jgi:hypothetical protein
VVVIDEAAQAVEPATLVPLIMQGCKQVRATEVGWLGGWLGLQPSRQQQGTCTQWPARREHGKKSAEEEEQ